MKLEIEFDWDGIRVRATGTYTPGTPAQTYGPPERCYPAEPDEWDWETVEVHDGNAWLNASWILATSVGDDWDALALEAAEQACEEYVTACVEDDADYEAWLDTINERDWK